MKRKNEKGLLPGTFFGPTIVNEQYQLDVEIKDKATSIFLVGLKNIAKQNPNPLFLSKILGALAYYLCKNLQVPSYFMQFQWILADSLTKCALNIFPNPHTLEFNANSLGSTLGKQLIEPSKIYNINHLFLDDRPPIELFTEAIDDFITELETIFSCTPKAILPFLTFLSKKIIPLDLMTLDNSTTLNEIIDHLDKLQKPQNVESLVSGQKAC